MKIPDEIKTEAEQILKEFNEQVIEDPEYYYCIRYRGKFLYLDRKNQDKICKICRLEYNGDMENWGTFIYLPKKNKYEFYAEKYAGTTYIDGTLDGAMRAGTIAFPIGKKNFANYEMINTMLNMIFDL